MNENERELKDLHAMLTYYCQAAVSHRREAQEHVCEAEWHESEAEEIRQEIAILEAE